MLISLALILVGAASLRGISHALAKAPVGYEDGRGFHFASANIAAGAHQEEVHAGAVGDELAERPALSVAAR